MSDPWDRPKFQHGFGALWNVALFLLTAITTTLFGAGPWYSIALLTILAAHEFGHYFACRWHNVDATLPYFIPGPPFMLTGTFGAVIRIREAFPSKRALFDIGVAGPIAGFITLLPFLIVGIYLSDVQPIVEGQGIWLGEPLLFKAVARLAIGPLPAGYDIVIHPMGFAAWFGLLATALNLLPFGQLDGGHIAYAVFGRRAVYLSGATLAVVMALSFHAPSWIAMAVMLAAMSYFIGLRHPSIYDEDTALDGGRNAIAVVALLILVLCFTPTPIRW